RAMGPTTSIARPLEIWVGTACDDPASRATGCHRITSATVADIAAIPPEGVVPEISVYDVMVPEPNTFTCDPRALSSAEWAIVDGDGDGTYDYFASQSIATDAEPPARPSDFLAHGSEYTLDLSWTPPDDVSDTVAYQALCADREGGPASSSLPPAPR